VFRALSIDKKFRTAGDLGAAARFAGQTSLSRV